MLLLPRGSGKVGRCRVTKRARWSKGQRALLFCPPGSETSFVNSTGGKVAIRRELIERGGTSELGLDLCRVTTKARWSNDQRAFSFWGPGSDTFLLKPLVAKYLSVVGLKALWCLWIEERPHLVYT